MSLKFGLKCPECGKDKVTCRYFEDGDSTHFRDNFVHECGNPGCGYKEEKLSVNGGEVNYEDPWPNCPFCGRYCGPEGEKRKRESPEPDVKFKPREQYPVPRGTSDPGVDDLWVDESPTGY